ncbi:MAG: RraA family protein [Armatimonadetes bacterium]|nr:RraA family protein [Armatimonadota bacterium]
MRELIPLLRAIDTPTLANAIELLDLRHPTTGFSSAELRHLTPELGVMCGFALTAEVETMSADRVPPSPEKFLELYRALESAPKPAVVVLREVTGLPLYSAHAGEVMSTVFKRLGADGLVSDSAVRDLPEVRALGFHYFARGTVASHGNFRIVRIGSPVTVCGLQISPGDLLHGDVNGLIQVPQNGRERLPGLAREVREREQRLLNWVRSEDFQMTKLLDRMTH